MSPHAPTSASLWSRTALGSRPGIILIQIAPIRFKLNLSYLRRHDTDMMDENLNDEELAVDAAIADTFQKLVFKCSPELFDLVRLYCLGPKLCCLNRSAFLNPFAGINRCSTKSSVSSAGASWRPPSPAASWRPCARCAPPSCQKRRSTSSYPIYAGEYTRHWTRYL